VAAGVVTDSGFGGDHVIATEGLYAGDGEDGGKFITGDDGPGVTELLLAVNDPRKVDSGVRSRKQEREARFLDHYSEGWRGHNVVIAGCFRGFRIMIERALGVDGTGEFAHLFAPDEVGSRWREYPAL